MGAAGDMLTAALYELLDENGRASFIKTVNSLGLTGVSVNIRGTSKCGICGTAVDVLVDGVSEDDTVNHEHDHHHEHHEHHHVHSSMADIDRIIDGLLVSDTVRINAKKIYRIIAEAESAVHGVPVTDIHFHEVGAIDAVVDVTSVCILFEMLAPEKICASPVCVGYGTVECAHGILPVPAPATANILKGIPMYSGDTKGEMCTPTGAALIRYFAEEFGPMPVIVTQKIGYGMGKRDYGTASALRAMLGEINDR